MNKLFEFDYKKKEGFNYLIGTDEAGRGPGAGPVFAAAVCFKNVDENLFSKLNDSKQLSEKVREELYELIIRNSIYSIHQGSVEDIERLNILKTSLLTMQKACIEVGNNFPNNNSQNNKYIVLVDGNKLIPDLPYNQQYIIKGDSKSAAIAAASILAKVSRDRFMQKLAEEFPQYGWEKNKGYLTKAHLEAVDKYGLTKWHRKKFFEKHFQHSHQLTLL